MKKLPVHIKIVIAILVIAASWKLISSVVSPCVDLYNNTKKLEMAYNKKSQEQITNYDGYYLAFTEKQSNANISKEVFLKVTSIIMESRKDGEGVAWKWLQENQQIPYSEFTSFYRELSSFISERYADNMKIEREKQDLARQHNTLLVTFPNTFFNKFLHIKPLVYHFGYVSKVTKDRFKDIE